MKDELFDELVESVKQGGQILKGELYRNFFAALPADRGITEWTLAECGLIGRLLKPIFKNHGGLRGLMYTALQDRIQTLTAIQQSVPRGSHATCRDCGTHLISIRRHDFVDCACGAIFIDGGSSYFRAGGDWRKFINVFHNGVETRLAIEPHKEVS